MNFYLFKKKGEEEEEESTSIFIVIGIFPLGACIKCKSYSI